MGQPRCCERVPQGVLGTEQHCTYHDEPYRGEWYRGEPYGGEPYGGGAYPGPRSPYPATRQPCTPAEPAALWATTA